MVFSYVKERAPSRVPGNKEMTRNAAEDVRRPDVALGEEGFVLFDDLTTQRDNDGVLPKVFIPHDAFERQRQLSLELEHKKPLGLCRRAVWNRKMSNRDAFGGYPAKRVDSARSANEIAQRLPETISRVGSQATVSATFDGDVRAAFWAEDSDGALPDVDPEATRVVFLAEFHESVR